MYKYWFPLKLYLVQPLETRRPRYCAYKCITMYNGYIIGRISIYTREGLYDTVIFNKEHLYSKKFPRAGKTYITTRIILGVVYPFNETLPTPPR